MNTDEFKSASSGSGRKMFLVLLLLVAVAAFGYDFFVAKPAFQAGYEKLQSMTDPKKDDTGNPIFVNSSIVKQGDLNGDGYITIEDVHEVIGRAPSATETPENSDSTIVETYSWTRGIPFMTYDAYVVYSKGEEHTTMYAVTERKPEKKDYRQKAKTLQDRPADLGRAGTPKGGRDAKKGDAPPAEGGGAKKEEGKGDQPAEEAKPDEGKGGEPAEETRPEEGKGGGGDKR
jgi:hypothetical protein